MIGNAGEVLLRAVRLIAVWASLWLLLTTIPNFSTSAVAEDASKMCQPQASMCGCATCGCTPDFWPPRVSSGLAPLR